MEGIQTTTTSFGARGYEKSVSGGVTTLRHEIGPVTIRQTDGGSFAPVGQLRDRLGSPLAQVSPSGSATNKRGFDSFGAVTYGDFSPRIPATLGLAPNTLRGFTGHEHVDAVRVIHMNGRIYDPKLGRFYSVDPVIQFPSNSQSLNPYSYVLNNPLSGRDPSGYEICTGSHIDRGGDCSGLGVTSIGGVASAFGAKAKAEKSNGNVRQGNRLTAAASSSSRSWFAPGIMSFDTRANTADVMPPGPPYESLIVTPSGAWSAWELRAMAEHDMRMAMADETVRRDARTIVRKFLVEPAVGTLIGAGVIEGVATASTTARTLFSTMRSASAEAAIRYGPMSAGPLPAAISNTFRSASYAEITLSEVTTLYRVYGGTAGQMGAFWTRTAPSGPLQSTIDLALNPQWGNTATKIARIQVPAGTTIFEGTAATQGGLLGGGNQVFIRNVDPAWILP